jgi:carbonic anhydrase
VKELIEGIRRFQSNVFATRRSHFERLARGQRPHTLFITCSDSRIDPAMLTQSELGDLFVLRNAGNIIPTHGVPTGEEATIEYAVDGLGVRDIVICGHSHCGAMKGLLNPRDVEWLPAVVRWLEHAQEVRRIVRENHGHLKGDRLVWAAVRENVLIQVGHLYTLPAVASRLVRGDLRIHAWVYKIESGDVFAFNHDRNGFFPIHSGRCVPILRPIRRRLRTQLDRLWTPEAGSQVFLQTRREVIEECSKSGLRNCQEPEARDTYV